MFQPFKLRDMEIANRAVLSPMCMYSANEGVPGDFHLVHYGSRAIGGAGLVFTEMVCPSADARISPVDASAQYLIHIRDAWNDRFAQDEPAHRFEVQEVVLTVPASFDEVARALTATAARQAGLEKFLLVEEPQAAFYEFASHHPLSCPNGGIGRRASFRS